MLRNQDIIEKLWVIVHRKDTLENKKKQEPVSVVLGLEIHR